MPLNTEGYAFKSWYQQAKTSQTPQYPTQKPTTTAKTEPTQTPESSTLTWQQLMYQRTLDMAETICVAERQLPDTPRVRAVLQVLKFRFQCLRAAALETSFVMEPAKIDAQIEASARFRPSWMRCVP